MYFNTQSPPTSAEDAETKGYKVVRSGESFVTQAKSINKTGIFVVRGGRVEAPNLELSGFPIVIL